MDDGVRRWLAVILAADAVGYSRLDRHKIKVEQAQRIADAMAAYLDLAAKV